jgi:protein-S-isoprenylcysteine O-methyltransferase Ste14
MIRNYVVEPRWTNKWRYKLPRNLTLLALLLRPVVSCFAQSTLAGNWSSAVTFKQGYELILTGPYRFVRHPIYIGILAMGLGTALDIGEENALINKVEGGGGFSFPIVNATGMVSLRKLYRSLLSPARWSDPG